MYKLIDPQNNKIDCKYNKELGVLEKELAQFKKGAMFLCKGEAELPMPRIEVKDVGVLSYPVRQDQLQSMIERATRAPFGKGTETITDLNVRRVWQIQNTDINITGDYFETYFNTITNSIKESLGLTKEVVTAELYKLLVYDKGSFFLPHRDSEKADKMFGTLVLSLPCPHRGGDLVVNHSGRDEVVSLENDSMSAIKWTAFFADCQHEVKPVTEGNRVCLVYNLLRSGGTKVDINTEPEPITQALNQVFGRVDESNLKRKDVEESEERDGDTEDKVIKMAKTSTTTSKTTRVDNEDGDDDDKDQEAEEVFIPEKLVYTLEHVYSKSNFTLESLKGCDATLARTLQAFAEECQIKLGLAFIYVTETGGCEDGGYLDPDSTKFRLMNVKDLVTGAMLEETMPLDTREIMPNGCLDKIKPYSEEAHEATGNEGASYERQYRQSAIVIWSTESMGKFTMVLSKEVAFKILEKELSKLGNVDANPLATHDLFIQMTKSLFRLKPTSEFVTKMLGLLCSIKSDQYLPKMMLAMLETTGSLYQTGMHQDAFFELLLQRSSMNQENIDSVMSSFFAVVPVRAALDMMIKLLDVISYTPDTLDHIAGATLLPKLANQIINRLDAVELCEIMISTVQQQKVFDGQRQQLLDKLVSVAQELLMPKSDEMRWSDYFSKHWSRFHKDLKQPTVTFDTIISKIESLESSLGDGNAPIYVTDSFLCQMYTQAFKVATKGSNLDYILPVQPNIERLNAAHPSWVANNPSYDEMLKMMIDYRYDSKDGDHNQTANKLYALWRLVHAHPGTLIFDYVTNIDGLKPRDHYYNHAKDIPIDALVLLLGLLHTEFGNSPHYTTLWDNVTKTLKSRIVIRHDADPNFKVYINCTCDTCQDLVSFLQSKHVFTKISVYTDRMDHFLKEAANFKLEVSKGYFNTLELKKTSGFYEVKLDHHNADINRCHCLFQLRPPNRDEVLRDVICLKPAPEVYPHTLAKVITPITPTLRLRR
ncbi:hypothetical protein SAMD00019534_072230 [Acytostelium subglobosum LB1]|uniref:hypothetical protein n=1 Tax=Acytostelium subglobosum LB1 TaxID=1410327 RepID=UPI000645115C|nr:hypothetical protein SAMD00019534_072230 [Acytostelium subglobosum LB1]GAM24048.1 hypothetical protein SAMD00019534_072230 [Acytostelium subglobosum LB1]|eukprot:XP_012753084.1 hypothetical protein SAMD00019534_072230 [Acytostelium subglobosum LB1]